MRKQIPTHGDRSTCLHFCIHLFQACCVTVVVNVAVQVSQLWQCPLIFELPRILNYVHYQKETWFATQRHVKVAVDVNWEVEKDASL